MAPQPCPILWLTGIPLGHLGSFLALIWMGLAWSDFQALEEPQAFPGGHCTPLLWDACAFKSREDPANHRPFLLKDG